MKITLPDFNKIIELLLPIKSTYDGVTRPIYEWINMQNNYITQNKKLINRNSDEDSITILILMFTCLLMRAMRGERGDLLKKNLMNIIKSKKDLSPQNFKKILEGYRWGEKGVQVMVKTTEYFKKELNWDWKYYFLMAEKNYYDNFINDKLLKIKNIKLNTNFNGLLHNIKSIVFY